MNIDKFKQELEDALIAQVKAYGVVSNMEKAFTEFADNAAYQYLKDKKIERDGLEYVFYRCSCYFERDGNDGWITPINLDACFILADGLDKKEEAELQQAKRDQSGGSLYIYNDKIKRPLSINLSWSVDMDRFVNNKLNLNFD